MWPSMQLKAKPKRESYTRGHRSQGSIDRATRDGITTAMEAAIPVSITSVDTGPSKEPDYSLEKEKQKLQAWLDSDDDPWPKRPTEPGKVPDDGSSNSNPNPARATFDDDFTEFVSAPVNPNVEVNTNPHKEHVSDDDEDEDKFHFEDEDSGYKELFDDGMPTNEEILLTSQRIFGPALAESGKKGEPGELDDAGELDEDDLGEFDLGSIMGALQNMKDEIAAMTDEDAKRRAAATVALGLVWGLEGGRR